MLTPKPSFFLHTFLSYSLHDFANLTSLFVFIWLNSDSSLRTLHIVHTWGIRFYTLRLRQGSNFMDRKNYSRPLNQRFLMTYSSLNFVCVDTDSRPINQRFLITYSSLIFVWFLYAKIVLALVLNQRFLIVRTSLIFVCVGRLDNSTNVLKWNIHGLSFYDFCLRKTVPVTPTIHFFPKNIRVNSTHYFIMRIPSKQKYQQIAFNHT